MVPDIHVPSLLKKVFDNLISYVKVIRRSIPPLTFSRSKRIEAKKLYYSDAEFSNLEEIPSERVLALEAEIEILKSQLNTIMKIINKDEGFQDENLFKNMNTQNSNYFSSSMPVARSFTDSFHPDFENNFIHLNPDASNLAPMAKNPPLAPPLPDFLKEIPDFDSDSTTTSVSDKDSLESSSISKALFEEMKSVKLKTVSRLVFYFVDHRTRFLSLVHASPLRRSILMMTMTT